MMNATPFPFGIEDKQPALPQAWRFLAILGLHAGLILSLAHTRIEPVPEPVAIRMEVRTITPPPPPPMQSPVPKPMAVPVKPQSKVPPAVTPPSPASAPPPLLTAAPSAQPSASSVKTAPSTSSTSQEISSTPAPPAPLAAPVQGPRFDADYLQNPPPSYPALSRKMREEGKVLLDVRVGANGLPEHISVKQGSGFQRLDEAAVNTVQRWRFVPARIGDEAVAANVIVPIVFRLNG